MSTLTTTSIKWTAYEKIGFRFVFIYFLLQVLPLDWKYYGNLFSIQWTNLHFGDIFYISRYTPQFYSGGTPGTWGIGTFADWLLITVIALAGTVIWSLRDKKSENYNRLYYWLRVILRYRLAIGIIAYGFIKFFPLQSPYPSISNLNTAYGDFNRWKLFSLSLGIVPGYESFLGLVEIVAGVLLLFRKTTTIGAGIILVFTGNVFISNLAYDGGELVYSLYLITIALFLTLYDAQRIYNLVALRKPTTPGQFKPLLQLPWQRTARLVFKGAFIFFFVFLYGYKTYAAYHHGVYQYPQAKGLAGYAGLYNVSDFRVGNKQLPYSQNDTARWNDVVFEKWATISIGSLKKYKADTANTEEIYTNDKKRDYEVNGTTGRVYYSYVADTVKKILLLRNKNSNYAGDQLILHYTPLDSGRTVLTGINQNKDSIYVQLNRINKKYLLKEAAQGRNKTIKL